jgi:phage head maturation protease
MWVSTLPDDPVVAGWWRESQRRARLDEAVRAEEQARSLRRLRRRVERLDMQLAGLQSADRWARIQRPDAPVEFRGASVSGVNLDQRIVEVIAAPYEEPALIEYRGEVWAETFDRGSFDGIETRGDQVRVNRNHDKTLTVGKVVRWWPSRSEGLVSEVRVAPTVLGDETLTLAGEDMLSLSVGFAVRNRDQLLDKSSMTRRIRKAFIDHLSFVESSAYAGAKVLAVRDRILSVR